MASKTQIPKGWRVVRLGDVAEVRSGIGFPLNRQGRRNGAYPFIKVSDMTLRGNETYIRSANNYVDEKDANELGANIFVSGTIVFPKVGAAIATNKKRALTAPTIIDNNMVGITVSDTQRCDARFLHGWFESIDLTQLANVSVVPSITGSRLKREFVLLPPLSEQRAIAAVLDSIDDAIEGTEAVIAATERLRDALLHELLTRGVPGWHTEWKEAPGVGTIPADWEVVRLGDVAEVQGGVGFPLERQGRQTGIFPFIKVSDMNLSGNETHIRMANNYVDQKDVDELAANVLPSGTIVFPKVGAAIATNKKRLITTPTVIDNNMVGVTVMAVSRLRCSTEFLYRWFESVDIFEFANVSAVPSITASRLKRAFIPFPLLEEQRATANLLDGVDVTLVAARRERKGLQLLKESTADALLSGRMRMGMGERIRDQ